jgi:type VI protein secretion system component Hcp
MRTPTRCMLSAALAAASLSSHQASAATLTVHTQTPKVNVHLPPTEVNVKAAPKVEVHEIHIMKTVDKSSPTLYEALHNGTHIPKATMHVRQTGGSETVYDDKKSDRPTESLQLNFDKIEIKSAPLQ